MQIKVKDGSTTHTLAQSGDRSLHIPVLQGGDEFTASILAQLQQFFRGASAKSIDRGNHTARGSFSTSTGFESTMEAQRYKYLHPVVTLRKSQLIIEIDTNIEVTIPDLTINQIQVRTHGSRAFATYQYQGGKATYAATFAITAPSGGYDRTFNPNVTNLNEAAAVLASVIYDQQNTPGSWSVTEPSGGWLRTLNPSAFTMQNFYDVVATIANDLFVGSPGTYTIAYWPFAYTLDPNATTLQTAGNVLATFLNDLQFQGTIS